MDARLLATGAGVAALGALGLGALVLTGAGDAPSMSRDAPVLIASAEPKPQAALEPAPPAAAIVAAFPAPSAVEPPPKVVPPVVQVPPPKPVPPKPKPPVVDHRYDGVLTTAEIGRIRTALKLTPDQEPYWASVAAVLRDVGRRQIEEVDSGQKPSFDLPNDLSSRLYGAAMPLLGTLREDQKEEVRRRAKMLGLESVASFI